jgi:hypothetical protein
MILTTRVGTNGMHTPAAFEALGFDGKVTWLASLSDLDVRAQASVIAAANRRGVDAVINAWVYAGYLSIERAAAALAAEANR